MQRSIVLVTVALAAVLFGFALAVPAIEAGGGGHGGCSPRPRDGTGGAVVIKDSCYSPAVLYVEPGTTVEWQQQDAVPHNVKLFDGELVGGKADLKPGDTVSRTFDAAGVYPYYCAIHPSMLGIVVVGDPTAADSGASLSVLSGQDPYAAGERAGAEPKVPLPGTLDSGKGNADVGASWAEAAIGLGLFGGLLVGLVAAGGALKHHRRLR